MVQVGPLRGTSAPGCHALISNEYGSETLVPVFLKSKPYSEAYAGIPRAGGEGVAGLWSPVQPPELPQQRQPGQRLHASLPTVPRHCPPAASTVPHGLRVLTVLPQVRWIIINATLFPL
jgi:hypothetical protein